MRKDPENDVQRSLLAAVALWAASSAPALACDYEGVRGYAVPRGDACLARYEFTAHDFARGEDVGIIFMSDLRAWFWRLVGEGDDLSYRLEKVDPPPRTALTGEMYPAPGDPVIEGTMRSGFCGEGFIRLTRIPGSCDGDVAGPVPAPADPPGYDPRTQGGALPVSGRSYGGNVRAYPSMNAPRVTGLANGTRVTILEDTGVAMGDFHWFQIRFPGGEGYKWGGILCADTEATRIFVCRPD